MSIIFDLLGGDLIKYAGIAIVAILAFFGNNKYQRNKGAKQNAAKEKEADNENANSIRNRVRDVKRVSNDDIEYRD